MIIIQNIDDNEYFKWCLIRYLNLVNHHPARITKSDKDFPKKISLDFKKLKVPVKVRDIHKNEKKNYIGISVLVMKIKKNIEFLYQKMLSRKTC